MAIRRGDFKLVGPELFNLKKDLAEENDIAATHPEIYKSLHERLLELTKERREPEIHASISDTIDQPLLVYGREENANPPSWLSPYIEALPRSKTELRTSARGRRDAPAQSAPQEEIEKAKASSAENFVSRDLEHNWCKSRWSRSLRSEASSVRRRGRPHLARFCAVKNFRVHIDPRAHRSEQLSPLVLSE